MQLTHRATRFASVLMLAPLVASCSGDVAGPRRAEVAAVTISPPTAELGIGGTVPFQATVKDGGDNVLADRRVVWNSSDTAVVAVSDVGVVTAKRVGTAQIAASSEGKFAIAVVTVLPTPVASVSVLPPNAQLFVGGTARLQAVAYDGAGAPLPGRQMSWSTSNASVASVDAAGLVTGVAAGSATITATSEGKSGTSSIVVSVVPVASVTVSPDPARIVVGQTTQLAATPRDVSGGALTGRAVTWQSGNPEIATVSSNGVVTGVAPGTVTVTATVEGKSGTASVVVSPVPASSVLVSPGSVTLTVGGTSQLTATVTDASGNPLTGRAVVWTSGSNAVATVTAAGLVTAVGPGTTTITAASEGKTGTATVTVLAIPVATVTVSPPSASVRVDQTLQLSAVLRSASGDELTGRTVTWSTSNAAIATVSQAGVVSGVAPGAVTITASVEGKVGTAAITVTPGLAAQLVIVSGNAQRAAAGSTLPDPLVLRVTDAKGNGIPGVSVTWTVTAGGGTTSVATSATDASGLASVRWTLGTKPGQQSVSAAVAALTPAIFTAQATNGAVASVTVSPGTARLNALGASTQLSAQAFDRFQNAVPDATFAWASIDAAIASVDAAGTVTARANGTARIVASIGGVADTASITVQQVPTTVSVTPETTSVAVGAVQQFTAVAADSAGAAMAGAQVSWSSSASQIASVDQSGKAAGLAVGTTTITAAVGAISGRAELQVVNVPVSRVDVSPQTLNLDVGDTRRLTARTYDVAGNELRGRTVTWSSSDVSVATVDASGNVQGKKPGTVTITATSEGKNGTATATVR